MDLLTKQDDGWLNVICPFLNIAENKRILISLRTDVNITSKVLIDIAIFL